MVGPKQARFMAGPKRVRGLVPCLDPKGLGVGSVTSPLTQRVGGWVGSVSGPKRVGV